MGHELRIQTADRQVRRVELEQESYTLGRAQDNDLCYPDDASLSRQHVKFVRDRAGWKITDLESKNGTLLNGKRITLPELLRQGDRVNAGQLVIVLSDSEEPTEPEGLFFDDTGSDLHGATVMTSLEGVLSSDPRTGERDSARRRPQAQGFDSPIVQTLIRAGRELCGHQPLEELFRLILDLSIDAVGAERGVLMTLEGETLVAQAIRGEALRISRTVRDRVLGQKASLLVRDTAQDALNQQLSISEQQIRSLMAVPLQTDDQVIGLVYVDSHRFVRDFSADDLNLLTVLANVAAIRIDHERHLRLKEQEQRRDLDLLQAAEIQRGILPERAPAVPGLDLAGHNVACRTVGGDYYDFIRFPDGRLAIIVGDVAGKGLSAALLVSSLQARIQLLTEELSSLSSLMSRLDRSIATSCPANRFITLFIALIDPVSGALTYCNAGHNPALLVRATGDVERLAPLGPVLGLLPGAGYHEETLRLEPGDLLAIYSDGVTESETPDEEEFGEARLAALLVGQRESPAAGIIVAVNQAIAGWTHSAPPADDVTLVIARRISV